MILSEIVDINSERQFPSLTWCTSFVRRIMSPLLILIGVLLCTLKLLKISDRSTETEEGRTFLDPVKTPGASQIPIPITVLLIRSIPLISF